MHPATQSIRLTLPYQSGSVAEEVVVPLEHRSEFCDAKQLPQALVQIDELQRTVLPLGRQVEANDGAQARAVHVAHIGQVQHNAFGPRDETPDCRLQQGRGA